MKKRISLLIALVMICTAVLSAIPLSATAESSYRKTWTLREEIEKALSSLEVGKTGEPDWSTSAFALGRKIWGQYHNANSAIKKANGDYDFSIKDDGSGHLAESNANSSEVWKYGYSLKADGTLVAGLQYQGECLTMSFTAPTSGTYALIPAATDKGVSAYAKTNSNGNTYNGHIRIYTDTEELFSTSVLTNPNVDGYTEYFTQNGETWVTLSKGAKIYIDYCPKNAEGGSGEGWVNGGILTAFNFTVSLEATVEYDVQLEESYNIKDHIDKAIPKQGLAVDHKGSDSKVATEATDTVNDVYHDYTTDDREKFTALYNVEGYTTWGTNPWALAHSYKKGEKQNEFAIRDSAYNYNWYNVTIDKETGLVTMKTLGLAVHWRVSFTAPKAGTYFIDLSSVAASSLTNQRAKFYIYTSTAGLNPEDGKRTDSTKLIYEGDYYKDRTLVVTPCANGYIPVELKAGEKIYFESEFFDGAQAYWGDGLTLSYTLNIIRGTAVPTAVNDSITLSSTIEDEKAVNDEFALTATGVADATTGSTIYWRTTDSSVATVDASGNVKVVGEGSCYIIAYNEYTETRCLVTTSSAAAVENVSINEDEVSIDPYIKKKLSYTADGDAVNVKWSSSDPYTIDVLPDGTLLFKDYGDPVTITLTVDGKTDTCTVIPTAHKHNSVLVDVTLREMSCEEDGITGKLCETCNQVVSTTVHPTPGHDYDTLPPVITTYPHIGVGGIKTLTCNICGEIKEERMDAGILDHVEIGNLPKRVNYEVGEKLEVEGMLLKIFFKNYDITTTVTDLSEIEFTYDFTTEGEKTVTFEYGGQKLSFNVLVESNENPLKGDANGDGKVDSADVMALMNAVAGSKDSIKFFNADINSDKKLDIMDIALLRAHLAGNSSEYFN